MTEKQETINTLWSKYKKTLEMLSDALDENASLKQSLTDATVDLTMPEDIIADLLAKYKIALTRLDEALNKINNQPTTLEEFAASNDALRSQLDELIQWKVRGKMFKKDNDVLRDELNTLNKDYWGRPKKIEAKPSTKNIQQDDYIKNLTKSKTGNKLK